ncbi:MAG: hypothetical protein ABIH00_04830 [Armatimonadota bacterium]
MNNNKRRGMSFIIVLLTVSLLVIISFMVVVLNALNLQMVTKNRDTVKAYWAAQAGLADSLAQLKLDLNWAAGFASKAMNNNEGNYTVTFTPGSNPYSTNNTSGGTAVTGWNNTTVPAGCVHLVSTGSFGKGIKTSQAIVYGSSGGSFFRYPYLTQDKITINRGFVSDSFDSSVGTYAETQQNSNGSIRSNDTQNNTVNISATGGSPSYVYGDVIVGPGADVNTAISIAANATVSGSLIAAGSLYSFPEITVTPNSNNLSISGAQSLPAGTYGTLSLSKNAQLTLTGTEYTFDTVSFGKDAQLIIPPGSDPVTVYLDGNMDTSGGSIVNNTLKPTHLIFYGSDNCSTVKLSSDAFLAIYARNATFFPSGSLAHIYGAVAVKQMNGKNNLQVHFDRALGDMEVPGYTAEGELIIKSKW